jgi:SAM-dependent methyltransferase
MRDAYLADVPFPDGARVLEAGSGTGAVARALAALPAVGEVVGLDPSPEFLRRARELAEGIAGLTFVEGDARSLPFEPASFDVVVFHTTLCHVPEPLGALEEAHRVLAADGLLVVFDGDYVTTTLATGSFDPLQACADAVVDSLVHDPYLVRRLPRLLAEAGFVAGRLRGHSYVEAPSVSGYMLAIADRGADALVAQGRIDTAAGAALKAEVQRRSAGQEFFGHIAYASVVARKPGRRVDEPPAV